MYRPTTLGHEDASRNSWRTSAATTVDDRTVVAFEEVHHESIRAATVSCHGLDPCLALGGCVFHAPAGSVAHSGTAETDGGRITRHRAGRIPGRFSGGLRANQHRDG